MYDRGRTDLPTAAALGVTLVFWGSAFPFIRLALADYQPGHLTLLRFLVASAAMWIIARILRMEPLRASLWAQPAALSLLNVIGYHVCLNYGLVQVQAGVGSLIVNTAPVFAYLTAALLFKERVDGRGWAGLAVSISGTALIALGSGGRLSLNAGALLLLCSAIAWGASAALVRPMLRTMTALQAAAVSLWAGTAGLLVFLPGLIPAVRAASSAATLSVVYLGVVPIAICYITWNYTLSRIPATRAVNYTYLIPLIAIIEGYLILGERPGGIALFGGLIALSGVLLANGGRRPS